MCWVSVSAQEFRCCVSRGHFSTQLPRFARYAHIRFLFESLNIQSMQVVVQTILQIQVYDPARTSTDLCLAFLSQHMPQVTAYWFLRYQSLAFPKKITNCPSLSRWAIFRILLLFTRPRYYYSAVRVRCRARRDCIQAVILLCRIS